MNEEANSNISRLFKSLGGVSPPVGDEFDPLSVAAIREIETAYRSALPEALKRMLQEYGALMFREHVTYEPSQRFPASYSPSNRGVVEVLLGQTNTDYPRARSISILHRRFLLQDALGEHVLPIGDDGLGDIICMSLASSTHGQIYVWNHEACKESGMYFVSRSYEDWLESLVAD